MTGLSVSVIVVSHKRPADLARCLIALRQLYYPNFEIVVVADASVLDGLTPFEGLKTVAYGEPNISVARNLGADAAAGEVLAFIDDDAVPEPTWLDHLVAPLAEDPVAICGGYVIGRNGFSIQWGAMEVDEAGWSHPVEIIGDDPVIFGTGPNGRAIRTQGTNMAIRKSVLADLSGFDVAYRFYHDETDLNIRVSQAGLQTAIVPRARVHHASAPSERRRADRVPSTLYDIGASCAVFHRKYLPPGNWAQAREDVIAAQTRRATQMLIDGRLEPKSFEALILSLHDGYTDGLARTSGQVWRISDATTRFHPIQRNPAAHRTLTSRWVSRHKARRQAQAWVNEGDIVTLIILDPTSRFHRTTFDARGFWKHLAVYLAGATAPTPCFAQRALHDAARQKCNGPNAIATLLHCPDLPYDSLNTYLTKHSGRAPRSLVQPRMLSKGMNK